MQCKPSSSFNDTSFYIPDITVAKDGSFSGKATEADVEDGSAATFTYTVSGHFHGASVAGSLRENVTYNNGTAYSCTTGSQAWTMTRDAQGSQVASTPPRGSYSGDGFVLYVSAGGTQVQDVTLAGGYHNILQCISSSGSNDTSFYIPDVTVAKDGSFSGKATQTQAQEDGSTATYTYTVSGHFHGTSSSGDERAAGSLREDVTGNNGTAYSCTTGTQPWTMTRDAEGSQVASTPPPGTYSGDGFQFSVSRSGADVQDVTLAAGYHNVLYCTPGHSLNDTSFRIPNTTVAKDGSFSAKATQSGVEDGSAATFTYTFSGHFHGTNSSGDERAAGSLREDVTYNNGTAYSCTTGTQPWSMTHSGS